MHNIIMTKQKVEIKIPLMNTKQSLLISDVLNIDKEFKGSGVRREISLKDDCLLVSFEGEEYKKLRVSINGFLKNTNLVLKTISLFS